MYADCWVHGRNSLLSEFAREGDPPAFGVIARLAISVEERRHDEKTAYRNQTGRLMRLDQRLRLKSRQPPMKEKIPTTTAAAVPAQKAGPWMPS